MLPFTVQFQSDQPAYEQVVFAVKKALLTGTLRTGDRFPSVRRLSQELRINPNTAHKVVATLTAEGLLGVQPGIGTVVQAAPATSLAVRNRWLEDQLEALVVQARHLGIAEEQLIAAVRKQWARHQT